MRMNAVLCAMLGVLSSTLATAAPPDPAGFDGNWTGKGTYVLRGDVTQCASIDLYFSASADSFVFRGGQRTCDKHHEKFGPVRMTYRDGVLYFGEEAVGTYRNGLMEVRYRMPDGDTFRNWRMSMRREGDNLVYEESRTMEGETTPMISFAGMLKTAPLTDAAAP